MDQVERQVIEIDNSQAKAAQQQVDDGWKKVETSADRATKRVGQGVDQASQDMLRVVTNSKRSIDSIVSRIEAKAANTIQNPAERLNAQRAIDLKRVGGDPAAIDRVNAAYERLLATQRKLDFDTSLARAQAASQRAAQGAAQFEKALQRVNQKQRELNASMNEGAQASGGMSGSLLGLAGRLGLVVGGFELVRRVIMDGVVGSALYAARTEQLGAALGAVGKANIISTATTRTLEEQLKKTGITTQDSRQSLARLIASHVDYTKAAGLARLAQNLGRVAGITSSEAFERLTHAIVTQQPEMLRTLGLNVNLQREFEQFARKSNRAATSLSEMEKRMIATNAVLREGAVYNGVYADSLETAGGKILSLKRYALEASNAFGTAFLPELTVAVGLLEKMASGAGSAVAGLARLAKFAAAPAYTGRKELQALYQDRIRPLFGAAPDAGADVRKLLTERLREATVGTKEFAAAQDLIEKQAIATQEAAMKAREEAAKRAQSANERTADLLRNSQEAEQEGVLRIALRYQHLQRELGITAEAKRNLAAAQALDIAREERQIALEVQKLDKERQKTGAQQRIGFMGDAGKERLQLFKFEQETRDAEQKNQEADLALEISRIETAKDARIRALDSVRTYSVSDKVRLESERAAIESQYEVSLLRQRTDAIDREATYRIEKLKETLSEEEQVSGEFLRRQSSIRIEGVLKAKELEIKTQGRLEEIQERAATRQRDIIIQRNEQIFDSLKRQAEGVIDALITRTNSLGDAIKNIFKAALLTPIKDALSSRIAAFLTGRVTGNPITLQSQGSLGSRQGGLGGGLGALLDAIGVGRVPVSQPGGTPPFVPQRQAAGAGGLGIGFGNGLGIFGAGGIGANPQGFGANRVDALRDFLGLGSSISTGGGAATTFGAATFGQKLSSLGKSDAALMAGLGLGLAGWKRGGWSGAAMMGAGGAAVGFRFGGPIGAAIGAAAGFGAGAIKNLFFKGAEEKIVEKVQQVYGLKIDKQFARASLLPIIQQEFGGNVDIGVRSAKVRELLSAYGAMTNQGGRVPAIDDTARGVMLGQRSGQIYQSPTYVNGQAYSYGGMGATGQRFAPQTSVNNIMIQLDGSATTSVMRGEAVQVLQQPETVGAAVRRASTASYDRRENASGFMDPLLVVL